MFLRSSSFSVPMPWLVAKEQALAPTPDIFTRCYATENIIEAKTPLATLTKKQLRAVIKE
jgi:hypothetical protein